MSQHRIVRTAGYFTSGDSRLFSWYHESAAAVSRDCVAVICPPFGHEYSSSHRTLRHLADALASCGVPALRFDYHGTGDSPGSDLDPDRVARWRLDIASAIEHARASSGRTSVCLVGVRLGATVAAIAAAGGEVDYVVAWNPVVAGRTYVRELQAIAMTAATAARPTEGELESAGFVTSAQTLEQIKQLDLTKLAWRVGRRVLLVRRDGQPQYSAISRRLAELGIAHDEAEGAGWSAMMAEPQHTEVPAAALETIAGWIERNTAAASAGPREPRVVPAQTRFPWMAGGRTVSLVEEACRLDDDRGLFGVLTHAGDHVGKVAVVMPNAGAQQHVGPNRLYVAIAREVAACGLACLRFDLQGLGDSVRESGPENVVYPDWAVSDTAAALDFLRGRGCSQFILMGLCSGAHAAFHAGLEVDRHDIRAMVLINPLTYRWHESMSRDVVNQFVDVQRYRTSVRDPGRWMKLVRGEVDVANLIRTTSVHGMRTLRSNLQAAAELLFPAAASPLARDVHRLAAMKRRMVLLVSEGDPGYDMLVSGAKLTAARAIRSGHVSVEVIEGADHTFSQQAARDRLLELLRAWLSPEGLREARGRRQG